MRRLERILHALFWLPILLSGVVGFALVEPDFNRIGIISAVTLGLFIIFVLLQVVLERRALFRTRSKLTALVAEPMPSVSGDNPEVREKKENQTLA